MKPPPSPLPQPLPLLPTMANRSKPTEKQPNPIGTGNVTPVQIAFIVDRYLADNNFTNTLAAFRAEAANLFSKINAKQVPKGLLGLGEILEEYIGLKEKKVVVNQEKLRVEMALQGIQGVMRDYIQAWPVPIHPLSPPTPSTPFCLPSTPSIGSPPGNTLYGTGVMLPVLSPKAAETITVSTPVSKSSSGKKRKASKSDPKVPPASKKPCTRPPRGSSVVRGKTLPPQVACTSDREQNIQNQSAIKPTSMENQIVKPPLKGSSIVKSLFRQQTESSVNSVSPKTPAQALPSQADVPVSPPEDPSQADMSVSAPEDPSFHITDGATSQGIVTTKRSMISSETIIVSPMKRPGYFSVERSYRVTSSPFKSSPHKQGRRDHVKGRLHFDEPDSLMGSEEPGTSSPNAETSETTDFDITDLDIFNGDFLELLADINDDQSSFITGSENNADNICYEKNQDLQCSGLSTARRLPSDDLNFQGPGSVTSVRTITQSITISSPVKIRSRLS